MNGRGRKKCDKREEETNETMGKPIERGITKVERSVFEEVISSAAES